VFWYEELTQKFRASIVLDTRSA